jgi:hypothetical protein
MIMKKGIKSKAVYMPHHPQPQTLPLMDIMFLAIRENVETYLSSSL